MSICKASRPSTQALHWRHSWAHHVLASGSKPVCLACRAGTGTSQVSADGSNSNRSSFPVSQMPQMERAGSGQALVPPVKTADELVDLPFYSQFPLDRRAEWRQDQKVLDELFVRPDAKLIPVMRDMVLVRPAPPAEIMVGSADPSGTDASARGTSLLQPVFLSPATAYADFVATSPARAFMGVDAHGAPYFAAATASAAAAREISAAQPGAEWRAARAAGPDLAPGDASLLAVASGLLVWHSSNGFSPSTGAPSVPTPGGFSRRCTAGGASTYPRIDPAVIMLVSHQDFALLGRKAEWPADRYSTLAGFLDLGEPLEAAVAREVEEEAGVRVDMASITYAASQPWPFPRSLMIGFHARAAAEVAGNPATGGCGSGGNMDVNSVFSSDDGNGARNSTIAVASARPWWQPTPAPARNFELLPPLGRRAALDVGLFKEEVEQVLGPLQGLQWPVADHKELQDVRWFHRHWLHAVFRAPGGAASVAGAGCFNVPGPYSLAYRLIASWVGTCPGDGDTVPCSAGVTPKRTEPWDGDVIPQVFISSSGVFKYVLVRLWDPRAEGEGRSKLLVWGDVRASYHNDLLQKANALARPLGLQVTPLGGGRIRHDPAARTLQIYGYSAAFGPAPHEVTAAILHRWFPLYDRQSITVSYDGY